MVATALVAVLLGVVDAGTSAPPTPTCSKTTSNSLQVSFASSPSDDLAYIALSTGPDTRPFALRTTAEATATLDDLVPSTTYYVTLRTHPASEPTIAWAPGWSAFSETVVCKTTAAPAGAPTNVARSGELSESNIGLQWSSGPTAAVGYEVALIKADSDYAAEQGVWSVAEEEWKWAPLTTTTTITTTTTAVAGGMVNGLNHSSTYFLRVREAGGAGSDPVRFRTAAPGMMYTTTHRISEYAEDVDFLENHNSATVEAMPLYLMTCSDTGNCQPWNKTQFAPTDAAWDSCEAALSTICPDVRGTGFNGCVECMDDNRDAVVKACGNFTDADKEHPGYQVHYYCGVGWPENLMYFSAITEYCVEHVPAPKSDPRWEGYAQYVSCNSDEVDAAYNNSARDPTCMCWVWDDRQMSMLPSSELNESCSSHMPWYVHEEICNCTDSKSFPESTTILPTNPSYDYVGAMPVFQPYGFYHTPMEHFPVRVASGDNLSTPKKGSCKENETPGKDGCKWKRNSVARVLYGPDLFAQGWDDAWVPDTETNFTHSNTNKKVFVEATHRHDGLMTQRCCGC